MRPSAVGLSGVGAALWMLCVLTTPPAWPASLSSRPAGVPVVELAPMQAPDADELLDFDIPAQPLADALRQYASLTHRPTLFRSDLVQGRYSAAVRGRYSSEAALYQLLDGTGLTVEKSSTDPGAGFVLAAINPSAIAPRASLGDLAGYPGQIQARVWDVLCADPRTAPGAYRALMRLEVDAGGHISRPRLLGTTGDARRDARLLAALQGVPVGISPPPGLPQPVTMLIVPRDAGNADGPQCGGGAPRP